MLLREGHSPRLAASLHVPLPGVHWAHQHMSCAAVQRVRPSLTRGRCCPAQSLWADPACAKDLCCDFGQIIPRVTGHSTTRELKGRLNALPLRRSLSFCEAHPDEPPLGIQAIGGDPLPRPDEAASCSMPARKA